MRSLRRPGRIEGMGITASHIRGSAAALGGALLVTALTDLDTLPPVA